jgi:hypothetical protein
MRYQEAKPFSSYRLNYIKFLAMKYYKFNRDRSLDPLQKYRKSCKKLGYLAKRDDLRLLDSFNFENQTWGALHKASKGYVIAKKNDEHDRMKYYAIVIQKLERELGVKVSSFPELKMMALKFFQENSEHLPEDITCEEVLNMLLERDKDVLTKLYDGKYEE